MKPKSKKSKAIELKSEVVCVTTTPIEESKPSKESLVKDYNEKISKYFTYHEALYLPKLERHAIEKDGLTKEVLETLKEFFSKMDLVREFFDHPIVVHVAFRPEEYNKLVGGSAKSAHMVLESGVAACDFHVKDMDCDAARKKILDGGKLKEWNMRMEDKPGSDWIHLDTKPAINGRFFKP